MIFPAIAADVWNRPFIAVGMLAFFLLIPLAVTSTNGMIKRLGGKNWARLHKLTYLIAILGVIHFWMIVKSDLTYPLLFGLVLAGLLGYRVYANLEKTKNSENKTFRKQLKKVKKFKLNFFTFSLFHFLTFLSFQNRRNVIESPAVIFAGDDDCFAHFVKS